MLSTQDTDGKAGSEQQFHCGSGLVFNGLDITERAATSYRVKRDVQLSVIGSLSASLLYLCRSDTTPL